MSMTDPIADLLTRIRNCVNISRKEVEIPYSKLKEEILKVLKQQGFILDYNPEMDGRHGSLRVQLKYGPDGEKLINHIQRVSKPGCRVYRGVAELPNVLDGLGVAIVSTPKGVMSGEEARRQRVGGEILCEVW